MALIDILLGTSLFNGRVALSPTVAVADGSEKICIAPYALQESGINLGLYTHLENGGLSLGIINRIVESDNSSCGVGLLNILEDTSGNLTYSPFFLYQRSN